jgi:SEC-C motif domain protein
MKYAPNAPCPCHSGAAYRQCCSPYHGGALPETTEALMRSRFSAYALRLTSYIITTTHPDGPRFEADAVRWRKGIEQFSRATRFKGLKILDAQGGPDDEEGVVTFEATLFVGKDDQSFTEQSLFRRHEGRWKYFSGEHLTDEG